MVQIRNRTYTATDKGVSCYTQGAQGEASYSRLVCKVELAELVKGLTLDGDYVQVAKLAALAAEADFKGVLKGLPIKSS